MLWEIGQEIRDFNDSPKISIEPFEKGAQSQAVEQEIKNTPIDFCFELI